jgi:hypothetical protein
MATSIPVARPASEEDYAPEASVAYYDVPEGKRLGGKLNKLKKTKRKTKRKSRKYLNIKI